MRIGIDISQIVYEGTGVARHVEQIVSHILELDKQNEYVLFGSSLRQLTKIKSFFKRIRSIHAHTSCVLVPIPLSMLHILWNVLHILPIEWFIGPVDIFWSSDWTQPPLLHAKGITTIHDVSFLRFPDSFPYAIQIVQKKRLARAFAECRLFFCDSQSTKNDIIAFYHIASDRLKIIYPGF